MNYSSPKKQNMLVYANSIRRTALLAITGLMIGSLLATSAAVAQQSSALSAVYGRGVHAYFAGNASQAEQHFTEVIQAGSTDPRPYYFRAMVRLNQGRQHEAENDMRVGATYEARNPGMYNTLGRSLQRVQGPGRRTLEKFRRQARLDRVQQGRQQTRQRYEQLNQRGPTVLRRPADLPLAQPIQAPKTPASGSGSKMGSDTKMGSGAKPDPFGSTTKPAQPLAPALNTPQPAAPTPVQPLPTGSGTKTGADDLFGAPAPTAADDPFGDAGPAPTPAPADEADPFGELPSPAPAEESADPFGESAPAESAAPQPAAPADDPFGESSASEPSDAPAETEELDPFGESSETEEMEAEEAAEEAPAEEEDDPFGESTDSADEDDPFGESADSADEAPAEDDPFGESMEEESSDGESDSDEEAPEADEDDPFGPFGATPGPPANQAFASAGSANTSNSASTAPVGQFFFALGQWIGSGGGQSAAGAGQYGEVAQANFELGPTRDGNTAKLVTAEDDPFGDADFTETESSTPASSESSEDDPFADF